MQRRSHKTNNSEQNHYYPFGLKHEVYVSADKKEFDLLIDGGIGEVALKEVLKTEYLYKYNGKEWQDELNLSWYDYHARNYDPAIGRWMNMDPLAEERISFSPFNYVSNNPVIRIDPTGMLDDWYQNETGDYVYDSELTKDNASDRLGENDTYLGESYSINVTQNGEQIGNVNLNANGSADFTTSNGQVVEFNDMTVDMGFSSGHKIMAGNWKQSGSYFDMGSSMLNAGATSATYYGAYDANKMYSQGWRKGTNGNYQLKGRNLSLFGNQPSNKAIMPNSSWGKIGRFGTRPRWRGFAIRAGNTLIVIKKFYLS